MEKLYTFRLPSTEKNGRPEMIRISNQVVIPEHEIDISFTRSQGAGGQNVNKVSTAVHLRFDIPSSSLPEHIKQKLLIKNDTRISKNGVLVIKASSFRTQDKNRRDALERLKDFVKAATIVPKKRRPTRPKKGAVLKRLDKKTKRGKTKALRKKVDY